MGGYSTNPADYKLLEEVGYGATATVYRAIYLPFNQLVAIKSFDLDRCNVNLDDLRREAQTMSLIDHPNVVRALCSFAVDRSLWVVMPFMDQGSCLHLIKIAYSHGFHEDVIGSILKETLKALHYLHRHGHIHGDVKAGNILLDTSASVRLADFGVSACLYDNAGDRHRSRNTFVGTPCWMAPEMLQPGSGYNSKADIWSFGITALELAHGHAPFSKYPPMKVLLMTIQNAPPGLDYDRDKKFSKYFKEMVAMCLVKDQTKRPSAEKLLKHSFFKHAKPPELSVKKLFADLPPLWNRVKALQLKDAAQLAVKKMPSTEEEAISRSQYQRGVSSWNFDIDDLKAQASLVRDDDDIAEMREEAEKKFFTNYKAIAIDSQSGTVKMNSEKSPQNKITSQVGAFDIKQTEQDEYLNKKEKNPKSDLQEPGLPKNIIWKRNGSITEATTSTLEKDIGMCKIKGQSRKIRQTQSGPLLPGTVLSHSALERGRTLERSCYSFPNIVRQLQVSDSRGSLRDHDDSITILLECCGVGLILWGNYEHKGSKTSLVQFKQCLKMDFAKDTKTKAKSEQLKEMLLNKRLENGNQLLGEKNNHEARRAPSFSGPLMLPMRASANSLSAPIKSSGGFIDSLDDKSKANLVQIKGRFSVTSENLDLVKDIPVSSVSRRSSQGSVSPLQKSASVSDWMLDSKQMDLIMNLLNSLQSAEAIEVSQNGKLPPLPRSSEINGSVDTAASERERLLLLKISELQTQFVMSI
ncbi:hypothetical protein JHK87_034836 [Glycine soja]|nr:hypothetical protein JHK87_034836 [Glycine soja]